MEAGRRRVLVVEDDPATSRLVARCLRDAAWDLTLRSSGSEAMDAVVELDPDVVVLDLGLPDVDGLVVLRELKADPRTAWVPVVVLTGRVADGEGPAALRAGAHDFIAKPFRTNDLEARVTAAWQVSARHRHLATERADLARSEADYRLMATTATDVMWRIGADGTVLWVSPSVRELLGWHPDELTGRKVLDHVHPDDAHSEVATVGDEVYPVVQRMAHRDGSWVWCETTVRVVTDPTTGEAEVHSTSRDVSARREAEEGLAVKAARYRQLVDLNGEAINALDAQGRVTFANPAMGELLGWAPELIVGRHITEFMDPDATLLFMERLERRRRARVGERYEIQMRHRSGRAVWVTVNATPVIEAGEFVGSVALLQDVTARRAAERALAESESRYRHLVDHLPGSAVFVVTRDRSVVMSGGSILAERGYDASAMAGHTFAEIFQPSDIEYLEPHLVTALAGVPSRSIRFPSSSGHHHLVDIVPLVVEHGVVEQILVVARDVTAARESELARRAAEEQHRIAFESAPVGMAQLDVAGRFLQVNRAFGELFGYEPSEVVGLSITSLCHPDDAQEVAAAGIGLADGSVRVHRAERRYLHASGHPVWVGISAVAVTDPTGEVSHVLAHFQDITDRKRFETQLQHMAEHDPLTGLRNRRGFEAELARQADLVARYGPSGALLMIDLDHFKQVNDTLGHNAGDEVIVSTADLLRRSLRETDIVARLGGDEFAVILPHADRSEADEVARKLIDTMREHVTVVAGDHPLTLTASIGVATFDDPALTGEAVLANADLSLYDAKDAGRDQYATFCTTERAGPRSRMRRAWVDLINDALDEDRFVLHAQPIVDLRTNEVRRYELLVRMLDPSGDLIPPSAFLYIAERVGLSTRIDRWVTDRAFALLADPALPADIGLEVNLSADSLGDPDMLAFVEDRLRASGTDPARLMFEIAESTAVAHIHLAGSFSERLSELGCRFALDNFGAGFGSFYYLKHLPFDCLKIDGEFIAKCTSTDVDRLVIDALVTVARGLGKETVAEFVGDEATLDFLRSRGVDSAQGYHVGGPRDVATILVAAPAAATPV